MHTVERPAGRLITFRVTLPQSDDDGARAASDLRTAIMSIHGPVIIVSDLRAGRILPPATTERFIQMMKSDNPKIERSALLLKGGSATLSMQVARMIKEAASVDRRVFSDDRELLGWLHPLLRDGERDALEAFVGSVGAEGAASSSRPPASPSS